MNSGSKGGKTENPEKREGENEGLSEKNTLFQKEILNRVRERKL